MCMSTWAVWRAKCPKKAWSLLKKKRFSVQWTGIEDVDEGKEKERKGRKKGKMSCCCRLFNFVRATLFLPTRRQSTTESMTEEKGSSRCKDN